MPGATEKGSAPAMLSTPRSLAALSLSGSTSATDALEVYQARRGVCRDFAHLGITFCRALNIPARLVVGYVWFDEPPQDFHAIFEAWVGGRWVHNPPPWD